MTQVIEPEQMDLLVSAVRDGKIVAFLRKLFMALPAYSMI